MELLNLLTIHCKIIEQRKNMDWENYWNTFITKEKCQNKIFEMDAVDEALGNEWRIETICHRIYEDYEKNFRPHLENVRQDFLKILDTFSHVHLQTSRVKKVDSLLKKIIDKRYSSLKNPESEYVGINADNYKDILTDLIGMRIILNYRGDWTLIHNEIIKYFPLDLDRFCEDERSRNQITLPHPRDDTYLLAQIPIAYYAENDDISVYKGYGLNTKRHEKNYRSIHYIVSYQHIYIEIQVRTIYDEAWSDCDHRYVYKHEDNLSHTALDKLSCILSELTNFSNDFGENMRLIYEKQSFHDIGNSKWETTEDNIKVLENQARKILGIYTKLHDFHENNLIQRR